MQKRPCLEASLSVISVQRLPFASGSEFRKSALQYLGALVLRGSGARRLTLGEIINAAVIYKRWLGVVDLQAMHACADLPMPVRFATGLAARNSLRHCPRVARARVVDLPHFLSQALKLREFEASSMHHRWHFCKPSFQARLSASILHRCNWSVHGEVFVRHRSPLSVSGLIS